MKWNRLLLNVKQNKKQIAIFSIIVTCIFMLCSIILSICSYKEYQNYKKLDSQIYDYCEYVTFKWLDASREIEGKDGFSYMVLWNNTERKPCVVKWTGELTGRITISEDEGLLSNVMRNTNAKIKLSDIMTGHDIYEICVALGNEEYDNAYLKLYDLDNDVIFNSNEYDSYLSMLNHSKHGYEDFKKWTKSFIICVIVFILITLAVWTDYKKGDCLKKNNSIDNVDLGGITELRIFLADASVMSAIMVRVLGFILVILVIVMATYVMMKSNGFWICISMLPLSGVVYGYGLIIISSLVYRKDVKHTDRFLKQVIDNGNRLGFIKDKEESIMQIDKHILEEQFLKDVGDSIVAEKLYEDDNILITREYIVLRHYKSRKRDSIVLPREELKKAHITKGRADGKKLGSKSWIIDAVLLDERVIKCFVAKEIKKKVTYKIEAALADMLG